MTGDSPPGLVLSPTARVGEGVRFGAHVVVHDGVVIGDHFPEMTGGSRASVAYTVGYMKALLERANAEFGG